METNSLDVTVKTEDAPFPMKVFRKWREGRRRSVTPTAPKPLTLFDDSSRFASETSSNASWDMESQFANPASNPAIVTPRLSLDTPFDDSVTEASTLPTQSERNQDDSPSNCTTTVPNQPLTMVIYERPASPLPLPDSIMMWVETADALLHSKEMQALLGRSRDVVVSAAITSRDVACGTAGFLVNTALLPVTVPLHVAITTTQIVAGVAGNVVNTIVGGEPETGERTSSESPMEAFVHAVFGVIPFMLDTAGKITSDIGSAAVGVVAPALGTEGMSEHDQPGSRQSSPLKNYSTSAGESSSERQNVLDRLRLDFVPPPESPSRHTSPQTPYSKATKADYSKYLLHVDDIYVLVSPVNQDPSKAYTSKRALAIDLSDEFSDDTITQDALGQLAERGLHMSATNSSAHIFIQNFQSNPAISVKWKAEGCTARQVRKLAQLPITDFYDRLGSQILVWSGKYEGPSYYGSENPLFLARGVVRRSPRDFYNMLWDSDRTGEYNKFSLGRQDLLVIDDSIFEGTGTTGTKLIRSDTKVPFTGMTVGLSALMHAQVLSEGPEEGFVIVSRSVNSGMAGCHVGSSKRVEKGNKNEILLGVNIMRPVPGRPDLTDLMSVSQVNSSMIPQFLAFRIGMMGLEDFFNNVRK